MSCLDLMVVRGGGWFHQVSISWYQIGHLSLVLESKSPGLPGNIPGPSKNRHAWMQCLQLREGGASVAAGSSNAIQPRQFNRCPIGLSGLLGLATENELR